jgi:SAM-dependent methyltransferase
MRDKLMGDQIERSGSLIATPNPIRVPHCCRLSATILSWSSTGTKEVEVHAERPDGPLLSRGGPSGTSATGKWVYNGMVFYLQDVSDGKALTKENTIAKTAVSIVPKNDEKSIRWKRSFQSTIWRFLQKKTGHEHYPSPGKVSFGDFHRLNPISKKWGTDRGTPVDRYYIENFFDNHSQDIHGHVMAVGDDTYTRMFGGQKVIKSDVLNLLEGDPQTTIVGDLSNAPHIPSNTLDCVICTQTLQLIYDILSAVQTIHRILKPGGVLLATFPGISKSMDQEWGSYWCWSLTPVSAAKLFGEFFQEGNINIDSYGNVLVAVSFLHGLAGEELTKEELDYHDPGYEIVIAVRAVKQI